MRHYYNKNRKNLLIICPILNLQGCKPSEEVTIAKNHSKKRSSSSNDNPFKKRIKDSSRTKSPPIHDFDNIDDFADFDDIDDFDKIQDLGFDFNVGVKRRKTKRVGRKSKKTKSKSKSRTTKKSKK